MKVLLKVEKLVFQKVVTMDASMAESMVENLVVMMADQTAEK